MPKIPVGTAMHPPSTNRTKCWKYHGIFGILSYWWIVVHGRFPWYFQHFVLLVEGGCMAVPTGIFGIFSYWWKVDAWPFLLVFSAFCHIGGWWMHGRSPWYFQHFVLLVEGWCMAVPTGIFGILSYSWTSNAVIRFSHDGTLSSIIKFHFNGLVIN